ncbi:lon protease-like protein 1 [Hibiscus syriacus]|uniref:Lon protease-like protein 1 n=1 Tax=Hibiscus syriacus TaxID=106335 RepID=A0A6A2YKF1_HIBSY|nr:lon protease-like protein 1 [Hibiscus syriacus]
MGLFEAIYYGGTIAEGFLRGTGTLFCAYGGGFLGEQSLGRVGYLVGSHLGSWVGGRIGLMVYDVVNGVHYLLQFVQTEEKNEDNESSVYEKTEVSEGSYVKENPDEYESPPDESSESQESSSFW